MLTKGHLTGVGVEIFPIGFSSSAVCALSVVKVEEHNASNPLAIYTAKKGPCHYGEHGLLANVSNSTNVSSSANSNCAEASSAFSH